jgi:Protein of unknown function (DUF1559)
MRFSVRTRCSIAAFATRKCRRYDTCALVLPARRGFTIGELLVCIGVVGILVSLVLPAIQRSREASRRLQCANNMRQIGIALQNHEGAQRAFPRAGEWLDIPFPPPQPVPREHAPHVYLLPYLGHEPLFRRIDLRLLALRGLEENPTYDQANLESLRTVVPIFLCPSDSSGMQERRNSYRANIGVTGTVMNSSWDDPNAKWAGAFFPIRKSLSPANFRDGLSTTVGFSERLTGDGDPQRFTPERDLFDLTAVIDDLSEIDRILNSSRGEGGDALLQACASLKSTNPQHDSSCGRYWFFASFEDTWYSHLLPPNHRTPDCGMISLGVWGGALITARSAHVGGVNCLMMDGSTRFVSDHVAAAVWRALGTRNANDVALSDF